jgi:hypothetical protein
LSAATASVGVDVDSLRLYYRIHGLDESAATNAAWTVGVPRFVALFAEVGIGATFYCVAEDLELEDNRQRVRALAEAGHEIGNHTWHHPYRLTRLTPEEIAAEIGEGRRRLEAAAGVPVVGFRAPGYNTSEAVISQVVASGHRYDSSVFSCAPYYLAKAGVMGVMGLRGRRSRSVLGTPRVLAAPRDPYPMATNPHRRRPGGLLQYPISVALGVPLIGTAFTALGLAASRAALTLGLRIRSHLTIEFHAVDLMGLNEDGLDPILGVQPDLKTPVARKRQIFGEVLTRLNQRVRVERLDRLAAEEAATT